MARKFLVFLLLTLSYSAYSYDTIVISDFDDTVKQTNVDDITNAAYNSVFTKKVFAGMSELFASMLTYSSDLFILSNSPHLLRLNVLALLRDNHFNVSGVSTRHLLYDRDKFMYKYNYIVQKIRTMNKKVILIGDDVGEDPEVYQKVKRNFPHKVSAIYIHKVKNRRLPSNSIPYVTIFELALNEYLAKRMNLSQVMALADSILWDFDMKNILPVFAFCPHKKTLWEAYDIAELNALIDKVGHKVTQFCRKRKYTFNL